jgi:hypothetical protein
MFELHFGADFHKTDHEAFKGALHSGLKSIGAHDHHLSKVVLKLRAGSVIAEVWGPPPTIAHLKGLPLHKLNVHGHPAKRSAADLKAHEEEKAKAARARLIARNPLWDVKEEPKEQPVDPRLQWHQRPSIMTWLAFSRPSRRKFGGGGSPPDDNSKPSHPVTTEESQPESEMPKASPPPAATQSAPVVPQQQSTSSTGGVVEQSAPLETVQEEEVVDVKAIKKKARHSLKKAIASDAAVQEAVHKIDDEQHKEEAQPQRPATQEEEQPPRPVVAALDFSKMTPNSSFYASQEASTAANTAMESSPPGPIEQSELKTSPTQPAESTSPYLSLRDKQEPSPPVEKLWVERPTSPVFIALDPIQLRTSWVLRPSVGTWSINRPSSALHTPIRIVRPSVQEASVQEERGSTEEVPWRSSDSTSSDAGEEGIRPRRPDIEIANDPTARPDQNWLLRPSTGTWLRRSPVNTTKPINDPCELRDNEGKWVAPEGLDATPNATPNALSAVREEAPMEGGSSDAPETSGSSASTSAKQLDFGERRQDSDKEPLAPLPAKLVRLRDDAAKLDNDCREATGANDKLRMENEALRLEIQRLMALSSPSDTPIWTART